MQTQFVTTQDFQNFKLIPPDKIAELVAAVNKVLQTKIGNDEDWDRFITTYGSKAASGGYRSSNAQTNA